MPVTFFKPNRKKTGALINFSFVSKDESFYIIIVKQCGEMNSGPFLGSKEKTSIKLSLVEIGAFINCFENRVAFNTVHKNNDTKVINLDPYYKEDEFKGFGLGINVQSNDKDNQSFRIGLTINEATLLREYLKFALNHIFSAIYSADKKQALEFKKTKEDSENNETQEEEFDL